MNTELMTIGEVATLLRVSIITIRRLHFAKQIPAPIKVGRQLRWRLTDLEEWIDGPQETEHDENRQTIPVST